jgi:catechol 2,3-dioxygenase-like lactoylglutathione lyase family enzyme
LSLRLNQVTLPVRDLAPSERFYAGLGLTKIVAAEGYIRFEVGDGSATLSLEQVGADVRTDGGGFIYFECDDLDARVAELAKAGYVFEAPPADQPWLWREAWLTDPDGRRLCLYHAGEMRRFPPWRIDGAPKP